MPINYAPPVEESIANIAKRSGKTPREAAYDCLLEDEGRSFLMFPGGGYAHENYDAIRQSSSTISRAACRA
ncbi:MAG: hypothetical protein F4X81_00330 [Gammaproteobacteria bacterium]|nr:hypothetical protein [Gammaproteobacteria bacterium]MXY04906.1 hypothetical protein [Gammaproteobacteria bacterium]MYE49894.1 hypothetical protein [Gammaproteobacteria bacterium]MYF11487.1 hypothetical protein [Gammaproteobacteria bacterium]MYF49300.1 hypothetical protein [Gammaproteobacteria bacterium]